MTPTSNAELELAEPIELSESIELPESIELAPAIEITGLHPPPMAPRTEAVLEKLRLLWRQRAFICRVTALGFVLTTVMAFVLPKQYESTTRLMPPDNQSTSGLAMQAALSSKVGSGLGAYAGNLLGLQNSGELFVGILGSRSVQDQLVKRFNLMKVYRVRMHSDARKRLAGASAISQDRKSGIITITITDHDPERAAEIGAAYVEELNRLAAELSTSGAHRERVFLEDRLKTVQKDLEDSEQEFSQFSSKNMAIDIKEQGKSMVEAAAILQGQLIAGKSEEEGLRQIYTDNNVRVRSVAASNRELHDQLEEISGTGPESDSASKSTSLYPSIKKLPLLGVTYADLFRRTKVQEALFEALTQQFEMAKVEEVREIPSVKVLDPAEIPEGKSSPPRLFLMMLGTLFSLVFSLAWLIGGACWGDISTENPGKQLAITIVRGGRNHWVHMAENRSRLGWMFRRARAIPRR